MRGRIQGRTVWSYFILQILARSGVVRDWTAWPTLSHLQKFLAAVPGEQQLVQLYGTVPAEAYFKFLDILFSRDT